jgi:hypothetical protein
MSRPASIFVRRTASRSKSRSMRVLALETFSNVLKCTILSAARQISANSRVNGASAVVAMVS